MDVQVNEQAPAGHRAGAPDSIRNLQLALRFALREMRGGLQGFYIFLACIALGVAAISGVNSVARSITLGIAEDGQKILGGDVSASLVQRDLSAEELTFLSSYGTVSKNATLRTMARKADGFDQSLVELKAVDNAYPLYGELEGESGQWQIADLGEEQILIEGLLAERLGLRVGDPLSLGSYQFTIADIIANEPDRLGDGFGFGPRVIISMEGLAKADLVKPGSLVTYNWKVRFDETSADMVQQFATRAEALFASSAWRLRSRENAAPALSRNIERFTDFLTLVGLAALIVGGVGVANAVRAFLETKRPVIATFKSLGAPGSMVFSIYLIQILLLASMGITIGLLAGAAMPVVASWALADMLPVPQSQRLPIAPLLTGAVYGILTSLVFAIWPLARAREIQATDLFRGQGSRGFGKLPKAQYLIALAICIALLVSLAIYASENRFIAIVFTGAMVFAFVLLRVVALAIQYVAKRLPHARSTELRLAIGNIHRPGSLTPSVVLSLGLGLALLVALALIDSNLREQVVGNISDQAPDFFFVDIQSTEKQDFEAMLSELAPEGKVFSVPMLRGRITELRGIKAEDYPAEESGAWVLRGDRGITYAVNIPENSTLSEGEWWPMNYSGPPLVSFAAEEAEELNLKLGDKIMVNVLGRNVTAEIASLRNVEWESLAINFVMVFSPNTFAGAPHSHLATLTLEEAKTSTKGQEVDSRDGMIIREIANRYPAVTSVRVREALDIVNQLIGQLATAIRVAATIALLTSILVLGGALAAGNQARTHDAIVLKTLGATRWRLLKAFIYEYAILGLATAVFSLLTGGVAAWFIIAQIMDLPFYFDQTVAVVTVLTALVLTVGFGLVGTWRVLGQKAAPVLRTL